MRALVYQSPHTLNMQTCAIPSPTADEVIVNVAAAGICGSDMHAFLGHDERRPPPLILGHEVSGYTDGQPVIINPLVVCQTCSYCLSGRSNLCFNRQIISMPPRQGGFAEVLSIPSRNIFALPSSLSVLQGALAEPLACGYHTVELAVQHSRCDIDSCTAVVLGGGAIGVAAALSLAARGVCNIYISETNTCRHAILNRCGNFAVVTPNQLKPNSAAIVIDAVGSQQTRHQASAIVQAGGVIVHIGLAQATGDFDMRRLTLQEIILCGAYTYTEQSFADTVECMAAGKLGLLDWFETRPLEEGANAFDDLLAGKVVSPKIILVL